MLGSSIIDIAIGLIFIYLLLSLICSAGCEIIERYSKKRAKDLEKGLSEMLRSQTLVEALYKHPLIYSLFPKPYKAGGGNLPSYIPARNFALALMDIVCPAVGETKSGAAGATGPGLQRTGTGSPPQDPAAGLSRLREALTANTTLPDEVKKALLTFVDAGSENPQRVRENIEAWFDSSMDRVSGWYKRRSQLIILVIGLVLAILLNVDTLAIVRTLSTDKAMRDSLVLAAQEYAKNNPTPTPTSSASSSPVANPSSAASSSPVASRSPASRPSPAVNPSAAGASRPGRSATASVSPVPATPVATVSPVPATSPGGPAATADLCAKDPNSPECRVKKNLDQIQKLGLPIGWTRAEGDPRSVYLSWQGWLLRIIGWLVTALALSLGAPFWFDMLNKVMIVRSTVKPKEKSPDEPSKS